MSSSGFLAQDSNVLLAVVVAFSLGLLSGLAFMHGSRHHAVVWITTCAVVVWAGIVLAVAGTT